MLHKILKCFPLPKRNEPLGYCVPIRGGLGGQINGFLVYDYLKKIVKVPVLADVSELLRSKVYRLAQPGEGLNQNVWNLGYYGIEPGKDLVISPETNSVASGYQLIQEGAPERDSLMEKVISRLNPARFPVSTEHTSRIVKSFGGQRIICIHIRQSDYINVASVRYTITDSLTLVKKLLRLKPDRVIYVSEQELDLQGCAKSLDFPAEQLVDADYFYVHAVMRRANVLITANSQFSLTAGLLGENALTICPNRYFGENDERLNKIYQSGFEFFAR